MKTHHKLYLFFLIYILVGTAVFRSGVQMASNAPIKIIFAALFWYILIYFLIRATYPKYFTKAA